LLDSVLNVRQTRGGDKRLAIAVMMTDSSFANPAAIVSIP
jgi:hypothetical protein